MTKIIEDTHTQDKKKNERYHHSQKKNIIIFIFIFEQQKTRNKTRDSLVNVFLS